MADDLRVLWLNPAADTLLLSGAGIGIRDGCLFAVDREIQALLERLIRMDGDERTWTVLGKPGACHFAVQKWHAPDGAERGLTFRLLDNMKLSQMPDLPKHFGFTKAEQQIIKLMMAGRSSTQIAEKLHNSVLTVRTHTKRIYSKLGINSREQLFASLAVYMALGL